MDVAMDLVKAKAKLITSLGREIRDAGVLQAIEKVPREDFVPHENRHLAYEDIPLPIKEGQTISQPFVVALMTESLELKGKERVLEVGTGSGYQAAILGELAREVITIERYPSLANEARTKLRSLGYTNVQVKVSGDTLGWPEGAPYDAIIVTAAAPIVPQELLEQLKDGGRLVIPVGSRYQQDLLLVIKTGDKVTRRSLGPCRFVPLIGEGAWREDNH